MERPGTGSSPNLDQTSLSAPPLQWIFWIYGTPQRPGPQPFTECLVSATEISFPAWPQETIGLDTIQSCRVDRFAIGSAYKYRVELKLLPPHATLGKQVLLIPIDPNVAMFANAWPSDGESQAFVDVVQHLQAKTIPSIDPNPYRRAQPHQSGNTALPDAHQPPTAMKAPNLWLILIGICVIGVLLLLVSRYFGV